MNNYYQMSIQQLNSLQSKGFAALDIIEHHIRDDQFLLKRVHSVVEFTSE
jgi:hypothetical protein